MSVLLEAGVVEVGAEAEDADGGGLELPESVEVHEGVVVVVLVDVGVGSGGGWGVVFGDPELPSHLELVGHVVVELLGGFGYGVFDDGVLGFLGAVVVDVDALVGGGFVESDGVDAGCGDSFFSADKGELAHDRGEFFGKRFEAEVGKPEA